MAASQPVCPRDEPLLTAAELGRVPDTPAEGAPAARTDHTRSDITGTLTTYPQTGAPSLSGGLCPSLSLSPCRAIRIPVPIPCTLWLSNLAIRWVRHCLLPPLDGNAIRGLVCHSLSPAEGQCRRPGHTPPRPYTPFSRAALTPATRAVRPPAGPTSLLPTAGAPGLSGPRGSDGNILQWAQALLVFLVGLATQFQHINPGN